MITTQPTTTQQLQEPVDTSKGAGTTLRIPTTSETTTDLPIPTHQLQDKGVGEGIYNLVPRSGPG